jgi:hypothetical protein
MPVELMRDYSPLWPAVQPKAQGVQSNAQFPTNRTGSNMKQRHVRKHMRTSFHKINSPRFAIIPVGDSVSPLAGSNKESSPMCDWKKSGKMKVDDLPIFYMLPMLAQIRTCETNCCYE